MNFNDLKIRYKIITGFGLVIILLFVFGAFYLYPVITKTSQRLIESRTMQVVEVGYGIVDQYYREFKKGAYSEDDAKEPAIDALRAIKYGNNDYYWINDYQPAMVMHPNRDLEGRDLRNFTDPDGKRLFLEMVEVVNKYQQGFVYYQ